MFTKQELDSIMREMKRWNKETLAPSLERVPERIKEVTIPSVSSINEIYTPLDIKKLDYIKDLGFPGESPFTRGIYPTQYRGKLWTMRQYSGYASSEETNKRFKFLLKQGQTGLSVAFDLPTQIGYDSDNIMSRGEVGRVGVPISSLDDMVLLFKNIPLGDVSTSMTINATSPQILALFLKTAELQGVSSQNLRGTFQNDILKEYVARGTYIFPPVPSLRLVVDIIEFCVKHAPKFNTISVSGYHMREAGATAVQEVAFTIANAIEYVKTATDRNIPVDAFAPRISFFFGCHNDFFEEIAKFRAARKIWTKIMSERFGAKNKRSLLMRYHVQTDGVTLTAQQPYNNIARVTIQALAAVLGGCQSLHTNSYDEALGLPSEVAVSTALRTQQIIAHESGIVNIVDPMGGSYYLEYLTNEIEEKALKYIEQIDEMKGAAVAIERGFYQKEISDSAYERQKEIENNDRIVVGVNKYRSKEENCSINILGVDSTVEKRQIKRLLAFKKNRNARKTENALDDLRKAAETDKNLIPFIIKCIGARATLGEISDALKEIFGDYVASTIV